MSASESRFYFIPRVGPAVQLESLQQALEARNTKGYLWIDLVKPDKEILTSLQEPFELHPLSLEDCLDEGQIPKIDDYPTNSFINFNSLTYSPAEHQLDVTEINIFIGEGFLITSRQKNGANEKFLQTIVQQHFSRASEDLRQGPAFLLHFILDQIVDSKFVAVETLEDELNEAEDAIMENLAKFEPSDLLHIRQNLLAVRKSLFNEREVLVKICRLDCPFISKKAVFFYRDIYDHLSKFFELTETSRDLVTSLMEMYLSMLNNQMTKAANNTNATVRRLTFITTIFMPLSLLAGIGGMSEWSMMTGPANWRIAYPVFLGGMVVLGAVNYWLLKRWEKRTQSQM